MALETYFTTVLYIDMFHEKIPRSILLYETLRKLVNYFDLTEYVVTIKKRR